MSHNTHVTLLTNLASSEPVTSPVTSPALVPPWNSSALEAPLSQLQTDSRDSRNLVLRSNSGITNTDLNITVSSLVQFQFLFLFLFLFLSCVLASHSCVSLPVHITFLCSDLYSDMCLFLMAMLSDSYI